MPAHFPSASLLLSVSWIDLSYLSSGLWRCAATVRGGAPAEDPALKFVTLACRPTSGHSQPPGVRPTEAARPLHAQAAAASGRLSYNIDECCVAHRSAISARRLCDCSCARWRRAQAFGNASTCYNDNSSRFGRRARVEH
eukprot:6213116-Pleurochrysis_carterae.AAC.4